MSGQSIKYIWKFPPPKDVVIQRALILAAYITAIQTDPNPTQVLIRSGIHLTTRTGGVYRPDLSHITVSVKNKQMEQIKQHQASHGYTESATSFNVTKVVPRATKPDHIHNSWPSAMAERPTEIIEGPPNLLDPETDSIFAAWASKEKSTKKTEE
ncbi:hypothetical protein EAF04_005434 [Stromatinia cepivora]|nr:hypothetical protein EAF04_005434 [Stromatinia cepivora]